MNAGPLRAGDLVLLTRAASPQFVRSLTVRVIRELTDRHPYAGWFWFEGYELNPRGEAVRRRELYALRAGVRWVSDARREPPTVPRSSLRPLPKRAAAR